MNGYFFDGLVRSCRVFPLHDRPGRELSQHGIPSLALYLCNRPVWKHRRIQANLTFQMSAPHKWRILGFDHQQHLPVGLRGTLGADNGSGSRHQAEQQRQAGKENATPVPSAATTMKTIRHKATHVSRVETWRGSLSRKGRLVATTGQDYQRTRSEAVSAPVAVTAPGKRKSAVRRDADGLRSTAEPKLVFPIDLGFLQLIRIVDVD